MRKTDRGALLRRAGHTVYKMVSGPGKPEGVTHIFDHTGGGPDEEQLAEYAGVIRSLRDLSFECFVLSFLNDDAGENGLAFYQMYATESGRMHVEAGFETPCGPVLYGKECDTEEAIRIMCELSEKRELPDPASWRDMTQEVLGEEATTEQERKRQAGEEAERLNGIGWDIHQGLTSGVPDPDGAIPYYEQAAALGNSLAMVNLGNVYEDREDYEQAYYWYNEAALAGSEAGAFNVANMYHNGLYVRQDYKKAYAYFKTLYGRHLTGAAFYMGLYSEYGYAGKKDYKAALRYYGEGLKDGDGYCAVNLGRMYSLGLGIEKDEEKGFEYYLMGYEAGDPLACANLGYCCETGQGTEKDLGAALAYYREGADLGDENCIGALARLEGGCAVE
ncbi:MAG: sel1 repeat family protein [Clostridia bacterium]|nr:sel1 repeat family protein [Clostridia bacterium]